jgi:hypothetical protein
MIKELTVSIATAALLFVFAPRAKSDTITIPCEEILAIPPVATHTGEPFAAGVTYFGWGIDFTGTDLGHNFNIGYTWQGLRSTSMQYFGTPNAQILAWNNRMSITGCAWMSDCAGTLYFGSSGITGDGVMWYSPHYAYMAIDTLSITTPEPGSLFLLGSGLLALAGLFRRKVSFATKRRNYPGTANPPLHHAGAVLLGKKRRTSFFGSFPR